jgi:phosphatidylserine synthase
VIRTRDRLIWHNRCVAALADLLTGSRALIALFLVATVGQGRLGTATALLAIAWLTDFFDGKSARAAEKPTHLGRWDLLVDTFVGAGLMVGLALGGYVNWAVGLLCVVFLGGGWIVSGNMSLSSVLQAIAYGTFMWTAYSSRTVGWWLPPVTAVVIAILNWRKMVHESIPGFLSGVADLVVGAVATLRRA